MLYCYYVPGKDVFLMNVSHIVAKIIRIITVPPLLALLLITYLYFGATGYFNMPVEAVIMAFCIVICPLIAYPVCFFVPSLRRLGREKERSTAFITTTVGYVFLLPFIFFAGITDKLAIICLTYVLSVVFLLIFNKIIGLRASGHACGVFGPLLVFIYAGGAYMVIPVIILSAMTIWSSLVLGRHSVSELVLSALCSTVAFIVSFLIFALI